MQKDHHYIEKHITQLYFGEAEQKQYQLKFEATKDNISVVKLHFFNPGETQVSISNEQESSARDIFACPCPLPEFEDRNDWCSTANCPEHPSPETTPVSHLIVHHSFTPNTSSDWAATVRSIWDSHVNGRGWSDIGYNWLIDPNGVIYQGRNDNILGAHFCSQNGRTMGVCVMGDFTSITPSTEAIESLERLLAWKSCDRDIEPLQSSFHPSSGLTLENISGHRDGCNTACPGDSFHPLLPSVRQGVVDLIEDNCATVATDDNTWLMKESLILSPNPVKDLFSIQFQSESTGNLDWKIMNAHQQVLLFGQASKENLFFKKDISIDELAAGIYFLQLDIEGKTGLWKIVKL